MNVLLMLALCGFDYSVFPAPDYGVFPVAPPPIVAPDHDARPGERAARQLPSGGFQDCANGQCGVRTRGIWRRRR